MRSVELFVGAGGLALGATKAGFKHQAVVEWDRDACNTIRHNQKLSHDLVRNWPLHEMDAAEFDFVSVNGSIDLLAGGPPCQPFSLGGKHAGHQDKRNMFPEVFRAARELKPRAVLMENVKGLTRPSFADYFEYIILQLSFPDLTPKGDEGWREHLLRLKKQKTTGKKSGLTYDVAYRVLNAADYGVPQRRERVIIVGFRSDMKVDWTYPKPTHSLDALLWDQWVSGEYWERHKVSKKARPEVPKRFAAKVEKLKSARIKPSEKAWVTVRDVLGDLPDPEKSKTKTHLSNHDFNPGARVYPGHTGSPLDEPAKTLKAGDHGVPGGENMLVRPDGSVRYFTVRECARLQTFPDDYVFTGAWSEAMRQLGNAVPVTLGQLIVEAIKKQLFIQGRGERKLGRPAPIQPTGQTELSY